MWSFTQEVYNWASKWTFPRAIQQWLGETKVARAVKLFRESDLSYQNIYQLASKMDQSHLAAAKNLYDDYNLFCQQPKSVHVDVKLSKEEKTAYDLSLRKKELSIREKDKLNKLLAALEEKENIKRKKTFDLAKKIIKEATSEYILPTENDLELILDHYRSKYQDGQDGLRFDEVSFLVRSRIAILDADNRADGAKNITYLVPLYKEFNRLKKKSEEFTGEDLLEVKREQLDFLFSGCKKLTWNLCFVDDDSPSAERRSIDVIKEMLKKDKRFDAVRDKIICLGYEDLEKQIACYQSPELNQLPPDEFAKRSVKGGAVQCALRYLSGIEDANGLVASPKADVILMTDADLSTNLGITGCAIRENLIQGADLVIGSRRLPGSVVVGKSSDRHLLSFGFNFLAHVLLNVQVSDTQVGCKAISKEAVAKIHHRFNDLTMSFDVELIRAIQDSSLEIKSIPTYWCDSPFESKSADQSKNMFMGLMGIFRKIYSQELKQPTHIEAMTSEEAFQKLADSLKKEPELAELMKLARDKKFHFMVEFSSEIYGVLTPKAWRSMVNTFSLLLCQIANGELSQETVNHLFNDLQILYQDTRQTPAIEFIMHEFPEIFSIAALLYKNRDYAQIIAPMLFGERIMGRMFSKLHYYDVMEWGRKSAYHLDNLSNEEVFNLWLENGRRTEPLPKTQPENYFVNTERQEQGWQRVKTFSDQLMQPKKITIVMQYDMDSTTPEYVDKVLKRKMQEIAEVLKKNNIDNIKIEFLVVDARENSASTINKYIDNVLAEVSENQDNNVTGRQIRLDTSKQGKGKANAVRLGMNDAYANNADIVGYIDFSNKIPTLDMGQLLADVLIRREDGKPIVAIGSRRLPESEILNKPLTFLLRSTGLNLAVKSLFPDLFHLSDTQTGFKFFSREAWGRINDKLTTQSLAFDIEILEALTKLDCHIIEEPVTFNDNNLDNTELAGPAHEMLPDLLEIRARFQKLGHTPATIQAPVRIGSGAEHTVYDLGDGSLLKIPTQFADPDFMIMLKNLLFNKTQGLNFEERDTGLAISQLHQILNSKYLRSYIPLMRDISDINTFVMRTISSFENKTKSFDLSKVLKYGRDLIGPFEFCSSFSVKLGGKERAFDERHQVKRCVKANAIFKDEFFNLLSSHYKANMSSSEKEECYKQVQKKLDGAVSLFKKMWRRGLFDLDTNILADLGYFETPQGRRLMCLDPGEVTNDLSIINIETAMNLLPKRSDILLMRAQLSAFPELDANEIVNYYLDKMQDFFNHIKEDMQKEPSLREFASELREQPDADFSIRCEFRNPLPGSMQEKPTHTAEDISTFLSAGYQLPYTAKPLTVLPDNLFEEKIPVHILVNANENYQAPHYAIVTPTERGSILPLCEYIHHEALLETQNSIAILLDAGSGTRSSLLGIQANSKGQIQIGGEKLNTYTSHYLQKIVKALHENGMNDYIVIGSCDDLFSQEDDFILNIIRYFNLQPSPGLFWADLPESGKMHMPLTQEDTMAFLNDHFIRDKVNSFFEAIPFTQGYADAKVIDKTMDGIMHLYKHYKLWTPKETSQSSNVIGGSIPGLSEVAERYMKLLQWHGMSSAEGGLKKPFLMIMKKSFMRDFIETVTPLIPEYVKTYITWENILLRGLKADKTVWRMLGKPPQVSSKKWDKIYDAIQALKIKHNIDTSNGAQNEQRGKAPIWQSLDDPYSIMITVERIFSQQSSHAINNGLCQLIADTPFKANKPIIQSEHKTRIIAINSVLEGAIIPQFPGGSIVSRKTEEKILLSGIELRAKEKLYPIPGHLVVEIGGEIYSTPLHPVTKEALKNQPVYHYNRETGQPDQKPIGKLSQFADLMKEEGLSIHTRLSH